MIQARLRRLIRGTPLQTLVAPVVAAIERAKLARVCNYSVARVGSQQACYRWNGRELTIPTLHESFSSMAMSMHERPTTAVFLRYVSERATVWDVGANVGFYTCLLGRLVGESGTVVAFEPGQQNFTALTENAQRSGLANVRAQACALSDADGEATMTDADGTSSVCRIVTPDEPGRHRTTTVITFRGDTLVAQGTPVPHFIKIDVEGHELAVVSGMTTTLARPECRGVLCEVHFALLARSGQEDAAGDIVRLLRDRGFSRIRWVSRSHLLALKP